MVPLDPETASGIGDRAAGWAFVRARIDRIPIVIGLGGDPWVKADAVRSALDETDAEIVVVHDADVLVPDVALDAAIGAVVDGFAWAVPHTEVHRYDARSTRALLDGDHSRSRTLTRWPYVGVPGGGIVVVRREVYERCPLDARFVGWGGEDQSWGWALDTLYGPPWRAPTQLVHLWHPHQNGDRHPNPRPARIESIRLLGAYRAAQGREDRMRTLLAGAGYRPADAVAPDRA